MQPASGLVPKWWFLARGAFACLSIALLAMNVWGGIRLHHFLKPSVYHTKIVELSVNKLTHVSLYYEIKLASLGAMFTKNFTKTARFLTY